MLQVSLSILVH